VRVILDPVKSQIGAKVWVLVDLKFIQTARIKKSPRQDCSIDVFQALSVVLSKLGRGEGRNCINNRLTTARSRDRDTGVAGE
jgi:hypothetical protein